MATVDSDRLLTHIRILYSLISCLFLTVITTSSVAIYVYQNSRCYDARLSAVDERFADNVDRLSVLFANDSATSNWMSTGIRGKREVYEDDHRQHRHHHHYHKSRKSRRQLDDVRGTEESATPWPWVPVTSRISAQEMMKFCRAHCQNGDPGPMGPPGPKGDKGDIGYPGIRGEKGNIGFTGGPGAPGSEGHRGFVGPPGSKGERGNKGLDGRNGLPGTPGLDGIPGRPGIPGKPGMPGPAGENGTDGSDGTPGFHGKPGVHGPPGPPGLHGPRGKKGADGIPGEPGVKVWTDVANNSYLLAPKFADGPWNKSISIREKEHLRLSCIAVGKPEPTISWQLENGQPIPTGLWNENVLRGSMLNFTHVNRRQSGVYECIATNALSDTIRKFITLNVLFAPTIFVTEEHVAPVNTSYVVLSCTVEMFPSAIKYWVNPAGTIIDSGSRFKSIEKSENNYRLIMMLNITRIYKEDYGEYKCYAKNDLGSKDGVVYLHRPDDPIFVESKNKPETETSKPTIHGEPAPPLISQEELCPTQVCPECQKPIDPNIICIGGKRVIVSNVPFNESVVGLRDKIPITCMMMEIGKPLYHRDMHRQDMAFGAWMKDAATNDEAAAKRVWLIRQDNPHTLFEYSDEKAYHDDKVRREIKLRWPFVGNTHLVYNGSFYYTTTRGADHPQRSTTTQIARLDLSKNESDIASYKTVSLLNADTNPDHYIYSTNHSYVDIAADENGLWFIHGQQDSPFTVVRKVLPESLKTEFVWNLTLRHRDVGEMFIICGVLYAVKNVTSRTTLIQLAFNLFEHYMIELPKLEFANPFRGTTMISYNARDKELLSWDKGSQLSYPIILRAIDKDDVLPLPPILDTA